MVTNKPPRILPAVICLYTQTCADLSVFMLRHTGDWSFLWRQTLGQSFLSDLAECRSRLEVIFKTLSANQMLVLPHVLHHFLLGVNLFLFLALWPHFLLPVSSTSTIVITITTFTIVLTWWPTSAVSTSTTVWTASWAWWHHIWVSQKVQPSRKYLRTCVSPQDV